MRLYLLTRKHGDWDEYNGAVIAATNPEMAIKIMLKLSNNDDVKDWLCKLISKNVELDIKAGVILSSYNAG